jgi:histidine kinase-like protein
MIRTTDWSHQILLAAEPLSAPRARDFVCGHLSDHHLSFLLDDMRLVVSELATNAVAHARTPFTVTLSRADQSVRVVIQDGSPSRPVRAAVDVMSLTGRGLMIVDVLSREWGTVSDPHGNKSVWAAFSVQRDEQEARNKAS